MFRGKTKSHSATLHFLSANTILYNSLRTDSTVIVPEGPWSSAASQTLSRPMLLAISATVDCDGWVLASLSRSEQSAIIMSSFMRPHNHIRVCKNFLSELSRVWFFQKVTLTNKK